MRPFRISKEETFTGGLEMDKTANSPSFRYFTDGGPNIFQSSIRSLTHLISLSSEVICRIRIRKKYQANKRVLPISVSYRLNKISEMLAARYFDSYTITVTQNDHAIFT